MMATYAEEDSGGQMRMTEFLREIADGGQETEAVLFVALPESAVYHLVRWRKAEDGWQEDGTLCERVPKRSRGLLIKSRWEAELCVKRRPCRSCLVKLEECVLAHRVEATGRKHPCPEWARPMIEDMLRHFGMLPKRTGGP